MKSLWIIPAVIVGSIAYVVWKNRSVPRLMPTAVAPPASVAGAKPVTLGNFAPVSAVLTQISSPIQPNPFLGGNPFLNF